jgi:hypothetical protein
MEWQSLLWDPMIQFTFYAVTFSIVGFLDMGPHQDIKILHVMLHKLTNLWDPQSWDLMIEIAMMIG